MYVIIRYSTVSPNVEDVVAACSSRQNANKFVEELQKDNSVFCYKVRLVIDGDAMLERIGA